MVDTLDPAVNFLQALRGLVTLTLVPMGLVKIPWLDERG
jgi:hypothetical protein